MEPILQTHLPPGQAAQAMARLPAMQGVAPADWLRVDSAYGAQLAEKARLMAERRAEVAAALPGSEVALAGVLDLVLTALAGRSDFTVTGTAVRRPDGQTVVVDRSDPLLSLSRVVQEDICLLERRGSEHVLTAALLCFPASWRLDEKIGRPLTAIHGPVAAYDAAIAGRVQRMFDKVPPDRILGRANLLAYVDPALFQPRSEAAPRPPASQEAGYLRSESQRVRRLPGSDAVIFTIHTTVVRRD